MTAALLQQYALTKKSRERVFNYMETVVGDGITVKLPTYQNQDIRHLLVHNADCYLYWLVYMAQEGTVEWPTDQDYNTMPEIRALYIKVDDAMAAFLEKFRDSMDAPVNNQRTLNDRLHATPLMIFTHVVTHEFHHKGQVMNMCRQLGFTPVETDVYLSFY